MKTSLFGIPVLFIDLLAGVIFLFLILITAAQFNLRLATHQQTGRDTPALTMVPSAETRKLREANAALSAQLMLKESELQGLRQSQPILNLPQLTESKTAISGDVQAQERQIQTLTEDRAILLGQLNKRNRELNQLLQNALTLRGPEAESAQTRTLMAEKAELAQQLIAQDDALLRAKQENERLSQLQAQQSLQAEQQSLLAERVAAQEQELTLLKRDRAALLLAQKALAAQERSKKELMARVEQLDQEMLRLRRDHGGIAAAEKELKNLAHEKHLIIEKMSNQEQQATALRQKMVQNGQATTASRAGEVAGLALLQGELANLTAKSALQSRQLEGLEKEKLALSEGIRQREMELTKLRATTPAVLAAIEQINPEDLRLQLTQREAEITALQSENDRLTSAQQKLTEREQEKQILLASIEGGNAQLNQLRDEIARLAAGTEEITRGKATLLKTKSELENQLREKSEQIEELKQEGVNLAAKSGMDGVLKSLHQEKEELMDWLRRDEEEIGRLKQENGRLLAGNGPAQAITPPREMESARKLFQELAQLKEQLRTQGVELSSVLENKVSLQQQIHQMQQDLTSLRQTPTQSKNPMVELQAMRETLQQQLAQKEGIIEQLQRENRALAATNRADSVVRALQTEQAELTELLTRRNNELERLKAENSRLKAATNQLPLVRKAETNTPSQNLDALMAQLESQTEQPIPAPKDLPTPVEADKTPEREHSTSSIPARADKTQANQQPLLPVSDNKTEKSQPQPSIATPAPIQKQQQPEPPIATPTVQTANKDLKPTVVDLKAEPTQRAESQTEQPLDKLSEQEPLLSPLQAKARSELINKIRAELAAKGIQTEVDLKKGRIFLPEGLNFPYGSAQLPTQGEDDLQGLATTLNKVLPCYAKS